MKLLALAAALTFAGAAHAQQTSPSTMPATPPSDQSSTEANASAPVGGLASPPTVSYVAPGQPATAPTSPSVDQAFPAPAPQAHYPICSRSVRDQCRQRGG